VNSICIRENSIVFCEYIDYPKDVSKLCFNDKKNKGGDICMTKKVVSRKIAELVATSLNKLLVLEANSASCLVLYEPKVPNRLEKYRKGKTQ